MTAAHPFSFFPSFLVTETWFGAQQKCLHFYTLLYRHSPLVGPTMCRGKLCRATGKSTLLQASRYLLVASSFLTVHGMGVHVVVIQESCGVIEAQHPAKEDNREKKKKNKSKNPKLLIFGLLSCGREVTGLLLLAELLTDTTARYNMMV